jgi:hypothetical protein
MASCNGRSDNMKCGKTLYRCTNCGNVGCNSPNQGGKCSNEARTFRTSRGGDRRWQWGGRSPRDGVTAKLHSTAERLGVPVIITAKANRAV